MATMDECNQAVSVLLGTMALLGPNGEHWSRKAYALDSNGEEVLPFDDRACSWCLTGAIYKELDNNDIFLMNTQMTVPDDENDHMFPANPLLASALGDALQEMMDTGKVGGDVGREIRQCCHTFEDAMACFNDSVADWGTVREFLEYSMTALRLKIDHIRHWQGERQ